MPYSRRKPLETKSAKRASRVRERQREKNEFEHLQYLQSQLDEDGNPLNILNTDEELLNNEQKFISRLIKKIGLIDMRSIAIYLEENYDEDTISELVDYYYSNKENKSWVDTFFRLTYKCLGFLNLNHLLTEKISEHTRDIIEIVEPTDKPVMTKEVAKYIIKECSKDLLTLNFFELINNILLVYSQNVEYCMRNGGGYELMDDPLISFGGLAGLCIIGLLLFLLSIPIKKQD